MKQMEGNKKGARGFGSPEAANAIVQRLIPCKEYKIYIFSREGDEDAGKILKVFLKGKGHKAETGIVDSFEIGKVEPDSLYLFIDIFQEDIRSDKFWNVISVGNGADTGEKGEYSANLFINGNVTNEDICKYLIYAYLRSEERGKIEQIERVLQEIQDFDVHMFITPKEKTDALDEMFKAYLEVKGKS